MQSITQNVVSQPGQWGQHLDNASPGRCQDSAEKPEFCSWSGTSIWSRATTGSCSLVYTLLRPEFCWLTDRWFQMVQSQVSWEVCWLFNTLSTTVLNSNMHEAAQECVCVSSVVSLGLMTGAVSTCWEKVKGFYEVLLAGCFSFPSRLQTITREQPRRDSGELWRTPTTAVLPS